jgi:Fic family protein
MPFTPIAPISTNGIISPDLIELAEHVCYESALLSGNHNFVVLQELREMLRLINSYYSNRIESEGTHPIDIEKAMRKEFSNDAKEKKLQMLSLAHIEVQKEMENWLQEDRFTSAYDANFIKEIHSKLYAKPGMESFLHIEYDSLNTDMIPGQFRQMDVEIGRHKAPDAHHVSGLMNEFEHLYRKADTRTLSMKLIYALSSHHRLVWIHPFLDGNGRVARLALDGALFKSGLYGYGLWNLSRGLARNVDRYKDMLGYADMARQGTMDGRGNLSAKALGIFVRFMLEMAIDQITYMKKYLRLDELSGRLERYIGMSQNKLFDIEPLPKHSEKVFKHLLLKGESARGEIAQVAGISQRGSTNLIKELLERGYIISASEKGAIRLRFSAHLSSVIFPELQ